MLTKRAKRIKRRPRTIIPKVKDLYRNFNENVRLEETLEEIKRAITETDDSRVVKNLKRWQRQYEIKIKLPKELREAITTRGVITKESVLRDYIYKNGLYCGDIEVTKFVKEKQLEIGAVDLFGDDEYIIELKRIAKSHVVGQVLGYYQYFKTKHNRELPIIIIAGQFWDNYKYASQAVREKGIVLRSLIYRFGEGGIYFEEIFK